MEEQENEQTQVTTEQLRELVRNMPEGQMLVITWETEDERRA